MNQITPVDSLLRQPAPVQGGEDQPTLRTIRKVSAMHSDELFAAYAEFTTPADLTGPAAESGAGSRNTATPGFLSYAETGLGSERE